LKLPIDHFSALAPFYEFFIHPGIPEKILTLADIPDNGTILDAGGGTGRVAQFLRGRAGLIVIADESFKMLREAGNKGGLTPICSHTEGLPFVNHSFERIIMVDAFHHVADQAGTINELWRVLKPGGRIVIEEPDVRSFGVKLLAVAEKAAFMRSHFLSPPQITSLFNYSNARTFIETVDSAAWIIVDKIREYN
jgi:ubiquinone/menaquinone biosynthesis C-methylase UbiE